MQEMLEQRDRTFERSIRRSGWIAGSLACIIPLFQGIQSGWPMERVLVYTLLTLLYLGLYAICVETFWLKRFNINWMHSGQRMLYFALAGAVCVALLAVGGDALLQPTVFTVPFVQAFLILDVKSAERIGIAYWLLILLGLWLGGNAERIMFIAPIYGALMFFMYAFVRLSMNELEARRRADALMLDLARQRDEAAALAEENARLYQQARHSATLAERNRIARELHDTIAQGLTAITMQLDAAQRSFERDPQRTRSRLERAHSLARATLHDVRQSVWTLAAPLAEHRSYQDALQHLVLQFGERSGIATNFTASGALLDLPDDASLQLVRIVQEALQNIEKHAQASTVQVELSNEADCICVKIRDNGQGFDPSNVKRSKESGFGIISMHERAQLAGGCLQIESSAGAGCCVTVQIAANAPQKDEAA